MDLIRLGPGNFYSGGLLIKTICRQPFKITRRLWLDMSHRVSG